MSTTCVHAGPPHPSPPTCSEEAKNTVFSRQQRLASIPAQKESCKDPHRTMGSLHCVHTQLLVLLQEIRGNLGKWGHDFALLATTTKRGNTPCFIQIIIPAIWETLQACRVGCIPTECNGAQQPLPARLSPAFHPNKLSSSQQLPQHRAGGAQTGVTEMCPTFLGPGGTEPNHCGCLESDGWKEKQEVGVLVLTQMRSREMPTVASDGRGCKSSQSL